MRAFFLILIVSCSQLLAAPNPNTLAPGWWSYFDVTGTELEERVEATIADLNALEEKMDTPLKEKAAPLVQKVTANLRALPPLKKKNVPIAASPPVYEETYSPTRLIELSEEWQEVKSNYARQEHDIANYKRRVGLRQKQYARLMLRYQEEEKGAEHLLLGLRLMGERSYLAILEQKLRVGRERLQALKFEDGYLSEEVKVASERLHVEGSEPGISDGLVLSAREEHQQKIDALLASEAAAAATFGESDEEQQRRAAAEQQMLLASSEELLARATLMFLQIGNALHQVVADNLNENELQRASGNIELWESELEEMDELENSLSGTSVGMTPTIRSHLQDTTRQLGRSWILLKELENQVGIHLKATQPWVQAVISTISSWWKGLVANLSVVFFSIGDVPITPFSLVKILFIVCLGYVIARLAEWLLAKASKRRKQALSAGTIYKLQRLIRYVILILAVLFALGAIGLDFTKITLIAGALSVGVGFGLKSLASNLLSGLTILFSGRLRVGDHVEFERGEMGRVKEIYLQNTLIRTLDGADIIVPNDVIMTGQVTNWTLRDPFRRLHVPFTVAYGTDKDLVKKIALEAADRVPATLKNVKHVPSPEVRLLQFGDNGLQFELVVWINQREAPSRRTMVGLYLWEIESLLAEHNISIPFPQRDVHMVPS